MSASRLAAPALLLALLYLACGQGASSATGGGNTGTCTKVVLDAKDKAPEPPKGGDLCPAGACNYQTQQGCASDQTCRPGLLPNSVVPSCQALGPGKSGAACQDWTDCGSGLLCITNVCRRMCCGGDWSVCDPGDGCVRALQVPLNGQIVPANVDVCYPVNTCQILNDSCAQGTACQIVDARGSTACDIRGSGAVGSACDVATPCAAGLICAGKECRNLCKAVECGQPGCGTDEACVHFKRDPDGIGECTPGW